MGRIEHTLGRSKSVYSVVSKISGKFYKKCWNLFQSCLLETLNSVVSENQEMGPLAVSYFTLVPKGVSVVTYYRPISLLKHSTHKRFSKGKQAVKKGHCTEELDFFCLSYRARQKGTQQKRMGSRILS